jgi:hypothetical protein
VLKKLENKRSNKMNWNSIKDTLLDILESLPNVVWYAGCFIGGFIAGSW